MSRQQFGGKYDQVVADEVNKDAEERKALRCQAHGCPMPWSSDFGMGRLCRWHSGKPTHEWPEITQFTIQKKELDARERDQQRELERGERYADPERLAKIIAMLGNKPDPLDWARRLKAREESGEKLSMNQKQAWRKALKVAKIGRAHV